MKTAIYIRTSTKEQFPEKQKKECLEFAKNKGYEIEGVYEERISGWKNVEREKYELIKEKARIGKIQAVIVWALDRWIRNRDTLLEDVSILKNYGCKLHSVKEAWLEAINIEGSIGKTVQDFLLGLLGSIAELESQRKSERAKMAYDNYTDDKWGRPEMKDDVRNQIIELHKQKISIRKIAKQVCYYDKNNNKKFVSTGYVHKCIKNFQ